jgi:hypothetical protein
MASRKGGNPMKIQIKVRKLDRLQTTKLSAN